MALSKHPRRFILTVTEIDCDILTDHVDEDEVVIKFAGKVMPSTKDRISKAFGLGEVTLEDKVLT